MVSMGSWEFDISAEDLRFSLRLRYARFDTFYLCSTEASGSTLVFGTRDTLRADGTLEVSDGGGCRRLSLTGFGGHDWCKRIIGGKEGNVGGRLKVNGRERLGIVE